MSSADLLTRLDGVIQTSNVTYRAKCPSHGSRGRTLAIKFDNGRTLLHCHAGCEPIEVLYAIGLSMEDLFDEPLQHNRPLTSEQEQRMAKKEGHKIWKALTYLEVVTGWLKEGLAITEAELLKAKSAKKYLISRGMIKESAK